MHARTLSATLTTLETVLLGADFVTLHVPLTPETHGMIDAFARPLAFANPLQRDVRSRQRARRDRPARIRVPERRGVVERIALDSGADRSDRAARDEPKRARGPTDNGRRRLTRNDRRQGVSGWKFDEVRDSYRITRVAPSCNPRIGWNETSPP